MNLSKIQRSLSKLYSWNLKNTNAFCEVYEALESLDKEYIAGILTAVQGAKHASEEAKAAQKDLSKTVERLIMTIEALKKFKGEMNSYSHLPQVDEMFSSIEQLKCNMEQVINDISTLSAFDKSLEEQTKRIDADGTLSYPLLLTTLRDVEKQNEVIRYENIKFRKKLRLAFFCGGVSFFLLLLVFF